MHIVTDTQADTHILTDTQADTHVLTHTHTHARVTLFLPCGSAVTVCASVRISAKASRVLIRLLAGCLVHARPATARTLLRSQGVHAQMVSEHKSKSREGKGCCSNVWAVGHSLCTCVCVCVFEEGEGETEQLWAWEAGSALMRNVSSLLSFCLLFPSIFSLGGGCKCPYNRRSCNH